MYSLWTMGCGTIRYAQDHCFYMLLMPFTVAETRLEDSDDHEVKAQTTQGIGRGKKKELWPLHKDDSGGANLPHFKGQPEPSLADRKNIIRSFFTHAYRTSPTVAPLFTHFTMQARSPITIVQLCPGVMLLLTLSLGFKIGMIGL